MDASRSCGGLDKLVVWLKSFISVELFLLPYAAAGPPHFLPSVELHGGVVYQGLDFVVGKPLVENIRWITRPAMNRRPEMLKSYPKKSLLGPSPSRPATQSTSRPAISRLSNGAASVFLFSWFPPFVFVAPLPGTGDWILRMP